jgi:diacylglycerol kinase (ATP)
MARSILYIINPISGTRKKTGMQQLIEKETASRKIPFKIFPSVESGDYSFLKPVIREEKITDIVIAGGDGTISQVVANFLNEKINFGIIPCGSGNGLALAAGLSKDPRKALNIVFNGKPKTIDGFKVNDQFACMLCGLGFDAKVAYDFAQQSRRGLTTYIKQVLKNFISAKAYSFKIKSGKEEFETAAYFISIANSNQFGNNFTIAPKASLNDGLLDVVIVATSGKMSMAYNTFRQVAGWNKLRTKTITKQSRGVIYFQTNKLEIKNLQQAPLHIDGDPAESSENIRIEILPNAFNLIQPL